MHAFSSVQSLSHVRLFATPWITACQASLSITNSQAEIIFKRKVEKILNQNINFIIEWYWPKTNKHQLFLQQKWVYSASAANCNLGSIMQSWWAKCKSPHRREEFIYWKEKKVERVIVNKESVAEHCLSCCQKRREFFFVPLETR